MKITNATKRKTLERKMAEVFEDEAKSLTAEHRKIMFDDLVSSFENRLIALNRAQSKSEFLAVIEREVHLETQ
ncbi:MAG TPA: hypothetical protein VMD05_08630 [Candidatus Nanoarchaeia archaeon]|nr:hypothetical protein [Candidatus Nanoarchaeia archaeon]